MTTPTKDQIAAAKAWTRGEASPEQWATLRSYSTSSPYNHVAEILLAALEAAEAQLEATMQAGGYEHFAAQVRNANQQAHNAIYVAQQLEKKLESAEADSARLDWLEEASSKRWLGVSQKIGGGDVRIDELDYVDDYTPISTGANVREALDAARKEAQP